MAAVKELLKVEASGAISFGDYTLASKTKLEGFEYQGDIYKVKTYNEITKLEKNEMFVYESVPGTAVEEFEASEEGVSLKLFGAGNAQLTVGLAETRAYEVLVNGEWKVVDTTFDSYSLSHGEEVEMYKDVNTYMVVGRY